ncbi:MAG: aldehyde ferredoxin oxidoreductase N-terminal domain-containing protein, partial [Planctomycetota bacterium]
MPKDDRLANVLYIDLSKRAFRVERREDLFEQYLGGTGVAVQLLSEECPEGSDPLGPDNPIVLAVGPLTGLFPLASKSVAMFKSPHTGDLGESHCGGRSAVAIRMAGYGAIVIKGSSDLPIYVAIHGDRVFFRNASTLWGMSNSFTVGRIIRENEPAAGLRTIMRIGRAGEKLVSYACVTTETYRHFGRLGLGAVFGSKRLKAVVVSGKRSLPVSDRKAYRKLYDEIHQAAVDSPLMKKYHDLGTAENILPLNELSGLPTRNLTESRFEGAAEISGESFAEHYLGRRLACAHCPIACIHIAALREPYVDEAYFYKTSMIGYDYEPIYAVGSMLGISCPKSILKLMDRIEALGLDVMTTGVVLAWATEAQQHGLISTAETGGIAFQWGEPDPYFEAARRIVERDSDFYNAVAHGVEHAASVY